MNCGLSFFEICKRIDFESIIGDFEDEKMLCFFRIRYIYFFKLFFYFLFGYVVMIILVCMCSCLLINN